MRRRYIRSIAASLVMTAILSGCSGIPMSPFGSKSSEDRSEILTSASPGEVRVASGTEQTEASVSATAPDAFPGGMAKVVPTPELKSGSQALWDRGVSLMAQGKLEPAYTLFEELTLSQPELAGPWANLGLIEVSRSNTEQARAHFVQALEANPHNCDARNTLGVLDRQAGDFTAAEKHYRACIESQPQYAPARLNLGILYELYMGRFGEALAAYQDYQLVAVAPDSRVDGWVMDLERRVAALAAR